MPLYVTIPVHHNYADYEPRFDFSAIVKRLLSEVSPNYLGSLNAVVLTNSSRLNQKRTYVPRKGRKLPARHIRGLYHHPTAFYGTDNERVEFYDPSEDALGFIGQWRAHDTDVPQKVVIHYDPSAPQVLKITWGKKLEHSSTLRRQ